jgi:hypothetical protein
MGGSEASFSIRAITAKHSTVQLFLTRFFMAKCSHCNAETSLYINEVPICLDCDKQDGKRAKRTEVDVPHMPPPSGSAGGVPSLKAAS